ncbi:MAG: DNA primase [Candidatus Wildermuthbacteria bacterium]|nr:DNA primase [Candidatus Wildermuthbacteria bacterium]
MLSSPVEEIKNRLDVVRVVGEYVRLQKAGASFRALCPFHSEKGPSFFVSPARQTWRCFGCSLGGDIFSFVMQIEGVEFGDALRLLAQKAGVELRPQDPSYARLQTERKRLYELVELACQFFEKQLSSKAGEEAKAYLQKRGVNDESFSRWRIGYAPDSSRGLLEFLTERGYREQEIGRAGLLVRAETGVYDRFRSRIMFPIFDVQSQVIGFGGRIFGKDDKELAKYINISVTPLYDKSRVLYGLDKAKLAIRKQNVCILVEGYMDEIMAFQAGTENVAATSGTALTEDHLRVLKRYTDNLALSFDMDVAGDSATKRGIDLAVEQGFSIKVLRMPGAKDPADFVLEDPEKWREVVARPADLFDYYFETAFAKADKSTAEGKKKAAEILLPVIKKIPNAIEQNHWIQRLADELGAKEEIIRKELEKTKMEPASLSRIKQEPRIQPANEQKSRRELLEERLLVLLFQNPENVAQLGDTELALLSPLGQEIAAAVKQRESVDTRAMAEIFPPSTVSYIDRLALEGEFLASSRDKDDHDEKEEFRACVRELFLLFRRERLDVVSREIKKAESGRDTDKVAVLLREFREITKETNQ